jgi:hypothetical protein
VCAHGEKKTNDCCQGAMDFPAILGKWKRVLRRLPARDVALTKKSPKSVPSSFCGEEATLRKKIVEKNSSWHAIELIEVDIADVRFTSI